MAHGIIQIEHKGQPNTVTAALTRRLAPHGPGNALAYYDELLLPPSAPDLLTNIDRLIAHYDEQRLPQQRDLLVVTTVRFEHGVAKHVAFELARGWARHSFSARNLAVHLIQHVPGLAGRSNKQHVHCLCSCGRCMARPLAPSATSPSQVLAQSLRPNGPTGSPTTPEPWVTRAGSRRRS
jgi:hypothetical protein